MASSFFQVRPLDTTPRPLARGIYTRRLVGTLAPIPCPRAAHTRHPASRLRAPPPLAHTAVTWPRIPQWNIFRTRLGDSLCNGRRPSTGTAGIAAVLGRRFEFDPDSSGSPIMSTALPARSRAPPGGARASGAGSARHNCTHDLGLSCIFSAAEVRARLYPLELLRETLDEPLVLVDKRWTESRAPMPNIRPAACGNWLLDQCDSATRAARHDTFLCPVSFRILADPRCAVSSCIRNSRLAIDRLRHRPVDQTSRVLVSPTTPRAVQSGSMLSRA